MSGARPCLMLVALALACTTAPRTKSFGEAEGAVAGSAAAEASREPGPGRASHASRSTRARLPGELVAVVATEASATPPCERVCGRLGDCLFESEDHSTRTAAGLELQCLDMCVHNPETSLAREAMIGCARHPGCAELRSCAAHQWDALAAGQREHEIEVIASDNVCMEACRWMHACLWTGQPPGAAYLPEVEDYVRECQDRCPEISQSERDKLATLYACLPDNCSYERAMSCWETM